MSSLPINHISSQTSQAKEYIEDRALGKAPILDTGFNKLNSILLGGFE
jgi:hypothetical protein